MAHCYYGKGDYENAVKYQTKAAEMEPHSGLIAKKLRVFRQALERRNAKPILPTPNPSAAQSETHQAQRH